MGLLYHCGQDLIKVIKDRLGFEFLIDDNHPIVQELGDRVLVTFVACLEMKKIVFASPSRRNVRRDHWRAMALQNDARSRHFIFSSIRNRISSSESALPSCASPNLNMTSFTIASYKQTLPMNFWLHRFRHLVVFRNLKSCGSHRHSRA
jgi:hypothetical protein